MSISTLLENRVNEVDMSVSDLARRSGVSRATVIRSLGGKDQHYSVSNLQAILLALGMTLDFVAIPAEQLKDSVVTQKARRLIALTQGNVALESQAVKNVCRAAPECDQGKDRIVQAKALGLLMLEALE